MVEDLRQASRSLTKRPGFTAVAVLSLALGIGSVTSVFALVRVLFASPPDGAADPSRLVGLSSIVKGKPAEDAIRYPDYIFLRDHNTVFSALASHFNSGVQLVDSARAEELNGHVVSANYLAVLGVRPAIGRFFLPSEDVVPGRDAVVVLSHSYWQRRFQGDGSCLGRTLALNGMPFTIVGVAEAGFAGAKVGWPVDVFVPNMMARVGARDVDVSTRQSARLDLIGRLQPERTLDDARAEIKLLARQLEAAHPETNQGVSMLAFPQRGVHPQVQADARLPRLLLASVSGLLLIACVNLSGLSLARNGARRREIAIRLALGAGRGRIVRRLVIESLLLSCLGAAGGLLVASWGNALLANYYGVEIDGIRHVYVLSLDGAAFLVSLVLAIVTGLASGLAPALQAARPALVPALKDDTRSAGFRRSRTRSALLVAQIALAVVLLVGAGLLAGSARTLLSDPGFQARNVVYYRTKPRLGGLDQSQAGVYYRDLRRRLESLGGVESVAFVRWPPTLWPASVAVAIPAQPPEDAVRAASNLVTPGFFETLGIPIVRGRSFEDRDLDGGRRAVVVNERLAERIWPDADAVGRLLSVEGRPHEVVGVASYRGLRKGGDERTPYLFRAESSEAIASGRLLVRVKGDPAAMLPLLRQQLLAVDPRVPIGEALTLPRLVENLRADVPLAMRVATFAAGLALLLSAIGLHAALAVSVQERRREIGIRMAVGARSLSVLGMVLREGLSLALFGLVLGATAALLLGRLLSGFLYGLAPHDPATFVGVTAFLGCVAVAACALPAWRAARVDPLVALRAD